MTKLKIQGYVLRETAKHLRRHPAFAVPSDTEARLEALLRQLRLNECRKPLSKGSGEIPESA
jgi:hypothetical protein